MRKRNVCHLHKLTDFFLDVERLFTLRHIAESTALQVGRLLRSRPATWASAEQVTQHDVKLVGDRGAEAVAAELLMRSSGLDVYSEEAGMLGTQGGDTLWVVDPLDGSANYARGVPMCCVSIALCVAGEPVIGVIYDFNADELFSGVCGVGAWLNHQPMQVSATAVPAQAILATGFPAAMDYGSNALKQYVSDAQSFQKVRSLGSAALMLAYVACGRFDAYRENNVRFWDVAAGMVLVEAAGGQTHDALAASGFDRRLELKAWNGQFAF
jgi:myo-inositol-1(or 4)-monophosphatase